MLLVDEIYDIQKLKSTIVLDVGSVFTFKILPKMTPKWERKNGKVWFWAPWAAKSAQGPPKNKENQFSRDRLFRTTSKI